MAGLTEFYCGWNEPSHASQFKWLEYTFKEFWDGLVQIETTIMYGLVVSKGEGLDDGPKPKCRLIGSPAPHPFPV
jgi:hypothetical protein